MVKKEISSDKNRRQTLRNYFVMCAFHSGSYTSFLIRQCLNIVPVKPKKWYFRVLWMEKSEISSNKTQKEAFQETAVWHVHSFQRVKAYSTFPSLKSLSLKILRRDMKWGPGTVASKEMSSVENWRVAFWATALWCVYSSHRVKSFFGLNSLKSLFLWKWERTFGSALCWKRNTLR